MSSFLRFAGITFVGQILAAALTFFAHALLARWLGPTGNGAFNLGLLIAALSVYALNLGLGSSNLYFVGIRRFPLSDIMGNSLAVAGGILLITMLALVGALRLEPVRAFLDKNSLTGFQLGLAALTVPLWTGLLFLNGIVLGQERFAAYNVVSVAKSFFRCWRWGSTVRCGPSSWPISPPWGSMGGSSDATSPTA